MRRKYLIFKLIKNILLASLSKERYKEVFCRLFPFHSIYNLFALNHLKNILFIYVGYFISSKTEMVRSRFGFDAGVKPFFFLHSGKHLYPEERGFPRK
jgi:hypothetical protein